jgi:hypothetical protein
VGRGYSFFTGAASDAVCCFSMKVSTGRSLLALGALVWLTGCAQLGPPMPPSLEVPKAPSDLRAARKGDKVTLTWTIPVRTTDRQRVRYLGKTRVCRSVDATTLDPAKLNPALKQCDAPIAEVAPPADFAATNKSSSAKKLTASFIDTLPLAVEQANPTGFAIYAVEVLNAAGRGAGVSNLARVPLVPVLPPFSDFAARATGQGVLISWECPPLAGRRTGVKYLFRIYRRLESSASATKIAEIDVTECAAGPGTTKNQNSFLDQTFDWEKTYFYRGTGVSMVETAGRPAVQVEGDDTPEVKVWAHDVFPPAVPSGLQAVFSGPGQEAFIDLIWAPVIDVDLDGYNIYRHEGGSTAVKVNTGPVKIPAFRDSQVVSGKTYFYSVSAVDLHGNESARSEEASESVP